jgi:protein TonB
MPARVDTLEQHDKFTRFFVFSAGLHAALFSSIAIYTSMGLHGNLEWGTPHALGGAAVGITPVRQIPLPGRTGEANPLANDTVSHVPLPPKPQPTKAAAVDPDALPIPARNAQRKPTYMRSQQYVPYRPSPDRPNQLYSSSGQALSSAMYGAQTGSGGVQMGSGSAFGYRFGGYRDLIEQRVAQKWRTEDVDPRLQTAPVVIVTFSIERNGSIANVKLMQGSGNRALDYSAQRAIYEAAPFPPLPQGYERSSADIEIWFQLKR